MYVFSWMWGGGRGGDGRAWERALILFAIVLAVVIPTFLLSSWRDIRGIRVVSTTCDWDPESQGHILRVGLQNDTSQKRDISFDGDVKVCLENGECRDTTFMESASVEPHKLFEDRIEHFNESHWSGLNERSRCEVHLRVESVKLSKLAGKRAGLMSGYPHA